MSAIDRLREVLGRHGRGLLTDLAFAVVWVTIVEVFFAVVDGPQWAYYMFMLAGIVAYFGFFASLDARKNGDESEP